MTATILRANATSLPLADESVDLIVTSPPYFALRSYQDGGEHYAGQLGSELTPAEFVDALLAVTRECVRVLKPSGSLWVNLGDKYNSAASNQQNGETILATMGKPAAAKRPQMTGGRSSALGSMRPKTLLGIPWRYALRCIDDLGLILRAEVIWSKPNGLPESVTDRVRRSHETWFHFVRQPRYYSAVDEIREPHAAHTLYCADWEKGKPGGKYERDRVNSNRADGGNRTSAGGPNPLGKLPGSVWTIPTQPLTVPAHLGVDHFAAFPMEWPRRIIQGWSPRGVCIACGEGRRPVSTKAAVGKAQTGINGMGDLAGRETFGLAEVNRQPWANDVRYTITGYACACPDTTAPTRPSVILDPFGGTGTTALVAHALGRHGISVDLSLDYCRLAAWRTSDPGELARALQVEKPPQQVDGQETLFDIDRTGVA